jgi:hypothetical protein
LSQYYQLLNNIKTIIHLSVGINLDILLLLIILRSSFKWHSGPGASEGKELTAREWGQVGPVAQADDDNQGVPILSMHLPTVRVSEAGINLGKTVPSPKVGQLQAKAAA